MAGLFDDIVSSTEPAADSSLFSDIVEDAKPRLTIADLRAKFIEDQAANSEPEKAAMLRGEDPLDKSRAGRYLKRLQEGDTVTPDVRDYLSTAGARAGAQMEQSIGGMMQSYGEEDTNRLGSDRARLEQSRAGRLLNRMNDTETAQRQAIAQKGRDIATEGRNIAQTVNEEKPMRSRAGRIIANAGDSVFSNLPGMAATVVTGNPAIGLSMMGAQSYGQAYDEARAKGLDIDDATTSAAIQGGTEVATEMIPFISLAKYLKTGNLSREVLKSYLADIPGEHLATAVQNATSAAYNAPNMTRQQKIDAAADYLTSEQHGQDQIDTFFSTLLNNAAMGGTARAARQGSDWYQRVKGGTVPPTVAKHDVTIPDVGIANSAVSVDDAIQAANAEVAGEWTHTERERLLKELGGEVEEAATEPAVAKKGSLDAVNPAEALASPMLREIEQTQLTADPFTDYPLQRPLITGEPQPAAGGIVGVEGYRQKQVEPNKPILNDEQQGIYDTFQGAPHVLKRDALEEVEANRQDQTLAEQMAAGRQQPANLPESQQNTDAQIPPVAGLSEPVDTQVSPEKGEEGSVAPTIAPDAATVDPAPNGPTNSLAGPPASWIIRDKTTGYPVFETFDKSLEGNINREKYEMVPALQHLQETNARIKAGNPPETPSPSPPSPKVEAPAPVGEEAKPPKRVAATYSPSRMTTLRQLRNEISQGEAGFKIFNEGELGGDYDVSAAPSTFPDYFRNKDYKKKDTLNIIDKALAGKPLTEKQQVILDDLMAGKRGETANELRAYRRQRFEERAQELGAVQPKEIAAALDEIYGTIAPEDYAELLRNIEEAEDEISRAVSQADTGEDKSPVAAGQKDSVASAERGVEKEGLNKSLHKSVEKYRPLVQSAVNKSEHLQQIVDDGEAAKGECEIAAEAVVDELHANGYTTAKMVALQNRLVPVEEGAWKTTERQYLWHAVVDTGDGIIDISGAQYGSKYGGVRLLTYAEASQEWGLYLPDPYRQASKTRKFPKDKAPTLEPTDDAGGWRQEVAVSAAKKVPTIGGVQKQGGKRQSTADLMDSFTPEAPPLFSLKSQTDTPAFKKWFGGSKVVDKDGNPLVVYHGTRSDFAVFGDDHNSARSGGNPGAHMFTETKKYAAEYASGPHGNIMPVFIKIENPVPSSGDIGAEIKRAAIAKGITVAEEAVSRGYDGRIVKADGRKAYVVYKPENIKSAIGNSGDFDPSNPDIRYSTTESREDLTLERVRSSFPTLPVTEDNGTFTVVTPSGIPIRISKVGEIEFGPEQRAAAEKEYGRKLRDDERPAAEFKPLDHGAIINLTERGIGELDHESFHAAMSLALTEKQKAAVIRTFGNEEKAAAEYQRLKESGALEGKRGNYWLSKIYRFLRALRQLISPTAKGVMEDVASGKVWGKAHAGDGGARYAAAWHGSPHDHNKFDSSKIGSGEGAQAYGHGLYFAGSKDVAEWYREKLTANQGRLLDANGDEIDAERDLTPEENFAAIILQNNGGDYAKAEADIRKWSSAEDAKEQVAMLDSLKAKGVRVEVNKGRLYEVELAPSEDEYLLWDKPLSEQSEKVQAALGDRIYEKEYFIDGTPLHEVALAPIVRAKLRTALKDADGNFNKAIETFRGYSDTASWQAKADELAAKFSGAKVTIGQTATKPGNHGERLYKNISRELGGDQAASEYLHSLGIRGIKYLDGTSRGKGEGNYNYVIFNDEDVEIKAKYSLRRQQVQSDLPAETKGQKFWRIMQDRYNRLKKIESFLEEKGVQLSELAKVSRGLSVMNGKVADQLQRFMDGKIAPLVEEAAKHKVSLADIEEFLLMQHAAEANEQMRKLHKDEEATAFGVTDAEADQKLQDFRARADFAQLERIANKFRALSDDTANMLEKEGIISPEMKAAWDNAYQFYVPLRGGDEDTKQGTGKGLRVNGKQQRRSGHGRRDEHVIENIVKARERAVKAVEKNRVALSVAQLVREAADDSIGTVGKPEKRRVFRNKPMYTVLHKGEPIASFDSMDAADRFTAMDKRDGGNLSDYVVRISSDPTVSWATSPTLGENEINAYVNGYQVRIQINDEIAAQALTNGGVEQLATIFKAGKSINNYLSRVYTGYDPRFTIRNTARDFTAGMINLTGDYGAATAAKIALNYPIAVKELIKAGKDPSRSSWVDRYRQAGGSTGASWLPSIERLGENIENMYHEQIGAIATYQKVYGDEVANGASPMKAHVKASAKSGIAGFRKIPVLGHFLKLIEAMNGVSENAFRLATFKTLIDEGKSAAEAGEAAKNSTINFDTRGEWGNQIGALYLFFNPAIQGVRRTGKALFESEHKFQAQAMAGSMALVGFMAAELARSMWDDDEWDKIPRSVKNRNLVIRTGEKTQLTIPIPYEYGTFVGIGYAINDVAHGKADAKTGLNLAGTLMDAASVIGNPVTDKGEIQPLQMTPTLIKLLLAPTMNLNNFGREIQPDKNDTSAKPDSQNMYRDTKGSYYEKAAGKLNELTGGTKYSAGAVDISPEVLKFYTRSALGGSFTFLDQVLNLGIMTANGVKPDVGEMPLVNVVARENTVRDTRSAFYEIANASKKALEEYNAAKKDHAFEIAQSLKEKNAELIAVSKVASTQKKLAKAKRDAIDAIRLDEDLDLAEKRERMKQLERQEEIIYNRLIARFRE